MRLSNVLSLALARLQDRPARDGSRKKRDRAGASMRIAAGRQGGNNPKSGDHVFRKGIGVITDAQVMMARGLLWNTDQAVFGAAGAGDLSGSASTPITGGCHAIIEAARRFNLTLFPPPHSHPKSALPASIGRNHIPGSGVRSALSDALPGEFDGATDVLLSLHYRADSIGNRDRSAQRKKSGSVSHRSVLSALQVLPSRRRCGRDRLRQGPRSAA